MLDGAIGPMSDEQKKWVKKINGHAFRLHDMINDILDLSKLQSGKTEIRRGLVEAKSLVRSTVDGLATLAHEKGLSLEASLPDAPTPVWADARHVERVLTNLLSNAIKYTPSGGKVSVTMGEKNGSVEFTVSDSGPGISKEHQETIFERFRQIRRVNDADSATQGIGLGLAICKEIISQHNGRIWVESSPGQGSRFIFSIPSLPASDSAKAA
jgi:signal transduction histidine kinase